MIQIDASNDGIKSRHSDTNNLSYGSIYISLHGSTSSTHDKSDPEDVRQVSTITIEVTP